MKIELIKQEIESNFMQAVMRAYIDRNIISDQARHPISGRTRQQDENTYDELLCGENIGKEHIRFAKNAVIQLAGYPHGKFKELSSQFGIEKEQLIESRKFWRKIELDSLQDLAP